MIARGSPAAEPSSRDWRRPLESTSPRPEAPSRLHPARGERLLACLLLALDSSKKRSVEFFGFLSRLSSSYLRTPRISSTSLARSSPLGDSNIQFFFRSRNSSNLGLRTTTG